MSLDKQELLPNNFNEKNLIVSAGDIYSLSKLLVFYASRTTNYSNSSMKKTSVTLVATKRQASGRCNLSIRI